MASEATSVVVPDQTTTVEHVEAKENKELDPIKQDIVSPSNPEEVASSGPGALVTESEDKIHQPAVLEVQKVDDPPAVDVPAEDGAELKKDTDQEPIVSAVSEPAVKDVEKETEVQAEVSDEPVVKDAEEEIEEQAKISDAPESAVESVEKPSNPVPTQEPAPEIEPKPEEVSEQESKLLEKPEPVAEEPEVGKEPEVLQSDFEKVENSIAKEPVKFMELEVKVVENPESVVDVVDKAVNELETVEDVDKKSEDIEPKESVESEVVKDGVYVDKAAEVTESSTDTFAFKTPSVLKDKEVVAIPDVLDKANVDSAQKDETLLDVVENSSEELALEVGKAEEEKLEKIKDGESAEPKTTKQEVGVDANPATEVIKESFEEPVLSREAEVIPEEKKEEIVKDGIVPSVDTTEPVTIKTEEGADSSSAILAGKSFEGEKTSEAVQVTEEKIQEDIKTEFASVEIKKDTEPQSTDTEDGNDSNSAAEVAEKSFDGEKAFKDVDVVPDEKKEENVKDDTTSLIEIAKDAILEGQVNVPSSVDTPNEPVEEQVNSESIVEKNVDELAKAAEVSEDTPKPEASKVEELSKSVDVLKTNEDPPKDEVLTKPVHKQSNNILSKVKHTIVKVKKAITGKSPSSKTITSDAKGDIQVK